MSEKSLFIEVRTPANQFLKIELPELAIQQWLEKNDDEIILKEKHRNRDVYYLKSNKVFYQQYVNGFGILFSSIEDFNLCFDSDKYYGFAVSFFYPNGFYYYFELKNAYSEQLKQTKKYQILSKFESNDGISLKFEDDSYLFMFKPDFYDVFWLPSTKMFTDFYNVFHGLGEHKYEPEKESKVDKLFFITENNTKKLTRLRASELTKYHNLIKESGVVEKNHNYQVHLLNDGQYLLIYDSDILLLFNNKKDFNDFLQSLKQQIEPDFFKNKDNIVDFFKNPKLSKITLSEFFKIDEEQLDFSSKSLDLLDKKINQFFITHHLLQFILPSLTQYFGEVLRKEIGGNWASETFKDFWTPFIKLDKTKKNDFLANLTENLREQEYTYKSCIHCLFLSFQISIKNK